MPLILLAIAVGGACGAVLRALFDISMPGDPSLGLPWSTVTVNISGSFLLGILAGGLSTAWPAWLREGVHTGLLGGFTTYSALGLWGASTALPVWAAVGTIAIVATAGVAVAYGGLATASTLRRRRPA